MACECPIRAIRSIAVGGSDVRNFVFSFHYGGDSPAGPEDKTHVQECWALDACVDEFNYEKCVACKRELVCCQTPLGIAPSAQQR